MFKAYIDSWRKKTNDTIRLDQRSEIILGHEAVGFVSSLPDSLHYVARIGSETVTVTSKNAAAATRVPIPGNPCGQLDVHGFFGEHEYTVYPEFVDNPKSSGMVRACIRLRTQGTYTFAEWYTLKPQDWVSDPILWSHGLLARPIWAMLCKRFNEVEIKMRFAVERQAKAVIELGSLVGPSAYTPTKLAVAGRLALRDLLDHQMPHRRCIILVAQVQRTIRVMEGYVWWEKRVNDRWLTPTTTDVQEFERLRGLEHGLVVGHFRGLYTSNRLVEMLAVLFGIPTFRIDIGAQPPTKPGISIPYNLALYRYDVWNDREGNPINRKASRLPRISDDSYAVEGTMEIDASALESHTDSTPMLHHTQFASTSSFVHSTAYQGQNTSHPRRPSPSRPPQRHHHSPRRNRDRRQHTPPPEPMRRQSRSLSPTRPSPQSHSHSTSHRDLQLASTQHIHPSPHNRPKRKRRDLPSYAASNFERVNVTERLKGTDPHEACPKPIKLFERVWDNVNLDEGRRLRLSDPTIRHPVPHGNRFHAKRVSAYPPHSAFRGMRTVENGGVDDTAKAIWIWLQVHDYWCKRVMSDGHSGLSHKVWRNILSGYWFAHSHTPADPQPAPTPSLSISFIDNQSRQQLFTLRDGELPLRSEVDRLAVEQALQTTHHPQTVQKTFFHCIEPIPGQGYDQCPDEDDLRLGSVRGFVQISEAEWKSLEEVQVDGTQLDVWIVLDRQFILIFDEWVDPSACDQANGERYIPADIPWFMEDSRGMLSRMPDPPTRMWHHHGGRDQTEQMRSRIDHLLSMPSLQQEAPMHSSSDTALEEGLVEDRDLVPVRAKPGLADHETEDFAPPKTFPMNWMDVSQVCVFGLNLDQTRDASTIHKLYPFIFWELHEMQWRAQFLMLDRYLSSVTGLCNGGDLDARELLFQSAVLQATSMKIDSSKPSVWERCSGLERQHLFTGLRRLMSDWPRYNECKSGEEGAVLFFMQSYWDYYALPPVFPLQFPDITPFNLA